MYLLSYIEIFFQAEFKELGHSSAIPGYREARTVFIRVGCGQLGTAKERFAVDEGTG